jgi:hypothetical protein
MRLLLTSLADWLKASEYIAVWAEGIALLVMSGDPSNWRLRRSIWYFRHFKSGGTVVLILLRSRRIVP